MEDVDTYRERLLICLREHVLVRVQWWPCGAGVWSASLATTMTKRPQT